MNLFQEIPANNLSISQRKLIFGVATNDAEHKTSITVDGKEFRCPIYNLWKAIIQRCYDPKRLAIDPQYKGCTVSDDWLLFSNFYKWVKNSDWEGKQIDKDCIKTGNKIYSEETCIFVTQKINSLIRRTISRPHDLPTGVTKIKLTGKYTAFCSIDGKNKRLGTFLTARNAHLAYLSCKSSYVLDIAMNQSDKRLSAALFRIHGEISSGTYYD